MEVTSFIQNHRHFWSLNDLDRLGEQAGERKPKTEPRRTSSALERPCGGSTRSFVGFRTHRRFLGFEVEEDIAAVSMLRTDLHSGCVDLDRVIDDAAVEPPHLRRGGRLVHPDARKVRFPGRVLRRWRREIDFAVARPRYAGLAIVQPLRMRGHG